MSERTITVRINADASPLVRDLRRAQRTLDRLRASASPSDRAFWRAVRAGMEFERALERVRQALKAGKS